MANRVVSTKLSNDEHKKIMEICNNKGITVSKLLKKTLLERIKEEKEKNNSSNSRKHPRQSFDSEKQSQNSFEAKRESLEIRSRNSDDRFMYY